MRFVIPNRADWTLRFQSFFTKRLVFFMFFASTFFKSFGLLMDIYERIYMLLAFHALLPGDDFTLPFTLAFPLEVGEHRHALPA